MARAMNDFDEQPIVMSKNAFCHRNSGVDVVQSVPDSMYVWQHSDIADRWFPQWINNIHYTQLNQSGWLAYHNLDTMVVREVTTGVLDLEIARVVRETKERYGQLATPIRVKAYVDPNSQQCMVEVVCVNRASYSMNKPQTMSSFCLRDII